MMKKAVVAASLIVALILAGCTSGSAAVTKEEIRDLSDKEFAALSECQEQKIYEDLGKQEADKYLKQKTDELIADIEEGRDSILQHELAKDGYYCDASERKKFLAERLRNKVEYKIDSEHTRYWMMGISKNKELEVSTTAESEAELVELAKTLKEKEAEGFDFVRATYYGGKKDLGQQTYEANGTICILTSKEGLMLFGDQYPTGPAYEQAEEDFKVGDGIVLLGRME